jgi:hypothetical protein
MEARGAILLINGSAAGMLEKIAIASLKCAWQPDKAARSVNNETRQDETSNVQSWFIT